MIRDLDGDDSGTYIVTYSHSGQTKGAQDIKLDVLEKVFSKGDVYDYATVTGFLKSIDAKWFLVSKN